MKLRELPLDTDTCIAFLRGSNAGLQERFIDHREHEVTVPAPVRAELFYGAARSRNSEHTRQGVDIFLERFSSLPFDDVAANAYGQIRTFLAAAGMLIGPNDMFIAAIAQATSCTLVTHNTREFSRIPGLTLDDWIA